MFTTKCRYMVRAELRALVWFWVALLFTAMPAKAQDEFVEEDEAVEYVDTTEEEIPAEEAGVDDGTAAEDVYLEDSAEDDGYVEEPVEEAYPEDEPIEERPVPQPVQPRIRPTRPLPVDRYKAEPAPRPTRPIQPQSPPSPRGVLPRPRPTAPVPAARPDRSAAAPGAGRPPAVSKQTSSARNSARPGGADDALPPDMGLEDLDTGELEEKDGETPTEPVTFDFDRAPLSQVIESVSRLTGRNFDLDPNVGNTEVTVITHDKIPPEMAYEVLESILSTRGFSMVETLDGHLIKIISTPDATQSEKLPLSKGGGSVPEGYDNYSTHIIPIKYAEAGDLATALKILGSKNAHIDTYAPTNTLIITDTVDGLHRMFSFLDDADIPGFDTVTEIFAIEYTRAEVLAQQLEQVLLDESGQRATATRTTARPTPTRPSRPVRPIPGSSVSQVIGSREEVLRMVPDERLNAIIVVASEGMMEKVRDLVKRLDTPTPYEANNLHIYELLNADAEQVEEAIQPLIGTAPRKAAAKGGAAPAQTSEVQPFEQKVQVSRYDQTNSLLIVASPQDYKLLEAFISRLDVPQRQVLVEAVIMRVYMTNDFNLSVDAAALTGNSGFGLTSTGLITDLNPAAAISGTDLAGVASVASTLVGGPGATLASSLLGLGGGGGLTTGVFDDITIEVDGEEVEVPFVPLLFQAIEAISDVEVLSQPSLVTVDNEEASIVVGQEVPFITSQTRSVSTTTNVNPYYGGYTRVQREEVGVKLKVTPQISEGDYVALELEVEISSVADQAVAGIDPNVLGPTTDKSLVKNKILVKDGATAVLAGLIKDSKNRTRTQAPVLGDIPFLGWLFGKRSNKMARENMVVLVTPHILKEGIDLDRITRYKVGEYHGTNIEELFERGFFKNIKKKRGLRKRHRPTFDRSEELTGRAEVTTNFGRGDIQR